MTDNTIKHGCILSSHFVYLYAQHINKKQKLGLEEYRLMPLVLVKIFYCKKKLYWFYSLTAPQLTGCHLGS